MPGQSVQVEVGPPVQLDDLLALAAAEQWSNDLLYRRIADRIGASMQQLYARLHNVEQQMQMPCIDDDALMPLIGMCRWGVYRWGVCGWGVWVMLVVERPALGLHCYNIHPPTLSSQRMKWR